MMDITDMATSTSNKEKAEVFLDRINRIFKIREVFGFCLSWFAAFSSR